MKTLVVFLIGLIAFSSIAAAETGRSVKSTQIQRTSERSSGISAPVAAPRPRHGKPER